MEVSGSLPVSGYGSPSVSERELHCRLKEVMTEQAGGSISCTYERDGLTLGYSVMGDGHPILFVHGATATGEFEWGGLAAGLSPGYRCVLPDLRGHGRSGFGGSDNTGG